MSNSIGVFLLMPTCTRLPTRQISRCATLRTGGEMRPAVTFAAALALAAIAAPPAAFATPVSGPHETIDNQLTTTRPNAPSGFTYTGAYHAAGNPNANPPYMQRMVSYNPAGSRFDTSVPARCAASDLQLEVDGAAACPADSRLGGGT